MSPSSRPKRMTCLPSKYNDYVNSDTIVQQLLTLDNDELNIPLAESSPFFVVVHSLASSDAILCSVDDDEASDPQTITEAKRSKYRTDWLSTIHKELESLKTKGVYEEVSSLPRDCKAVQCKWVLQFTHQRDKDGTISRFKARLVTKGFTQIPGQDFTFTFAPVACWDSIRSLLCIVTLRDYEIRQLDVKTAYLNGPLDEEIYMRAPNWFSSTIPFW